MPYAHDNRISQEPIDGGIEITDDQYIEALAGMLEGKVVTIEGGFKVDFPPPPEEPEPEEPGEEILPDLAPWQFRAILHLSGKQDDLQNFIDSLPEPQKTIAQAKLEYTLVFQRNNDLVLTAQQALGLSEAELDALWSQALTL